jgi:hypothetical protein
VGGPSQAEYSLQESQAAETQSYMAQQSTLYGESQALQATLTPLLEKEISNPTGFSPQELSDLNASNVNTTGAQYANVQKQLNATNASQNMAGLTSGVASAETAALKGSAAGTVALNAQSTQLANAQLQNTNKNIAQSQLLGMQSGMGSQAISQGSLENQSNQNAFGEASTIQQQNSQSGVQGILGGVLGAAAGVGMGVLTGGMSSLAGGLGGGMGDSASTGGY